MTRLTELQERQRGLQKAYDAQRIKLAAAQATIYRIAGVRCWTNEDGKQFVFADDLYAALEGTGVEGDRQAV